MCIGLTSTRTNQNDVLVIIGNGKKKETYKLSGTPFGLNLNTFNVDNFLYAKKSEKLDYWCT